MSNVKKCRTPNKSVLIHHYEMTINTKISFKEYCKLLFGLAYKKPVMKIIVSIAVAVLIWILSYYFHLLPVPKPEIYQYITLTLIAVVQPTAIYWTIKRNYDSSNHLGEKLQIKISEHQINIRGESFYTELSWDKIFKVDEETDHLLIYQNNLSAIIISKKDLAPPEIKEFRRIVKAIASFPIHLRESA
jgi:hypothetical protein